MRTPRFRALSRSLALLAAAVLVVLGVVEAPHTVHHFFAGGAEASPECALASAADHTQAEPVPAGLQAPIQEVDLALPTAPSGPLPSRVLGRSPARAPPTPAV